MIQNRFSSDGEPTLKWLKQPKKKHRKMELKEDFTYLDNSGKEWTAPKGTIINGTSYPEWRKNLSFWKNFKNIIPIVVIKAFSWYPFVGFERTASIIHDYLVDKEIGDDKEVHALYGEMVFELLEEAYLGERDTYHYKAAKAKANLLAWAVKLGGPKW